MQPENGIVVPLTLVDRSGRRIDQGPEKVTFGAIHLRRWQVHPVAGSSATFPGSAAHQVKVSFDVLLDHDAPSVRWFEVGFCLAESGSTIVAAVPRGAVEPQPETSYGLSRNLEFVPAEGSTALAHVPATEGPVHVYGASGDHIRWLYVAATETGVRPGSYSAWMVLLAPADRTSEKFRLTARFDPELAEGDDFGATGTSREFSIELTGPTLAPQVDTASTSGPAIGLPARSSRIFICYAHEDEAHKKLVRDFADLLRACGLDPVIDHAHEGPRMSWDHWALHQIRGADFIAVIASPVVKAVGDGTYEGTDRAGIRNELGMIRNLVQKHPDWAGHLLPVVLPGRSVDEIPMFLHPQTMDHYQVEALIESELGTLLKAIDDTAPWQGWERP
ncbi:toll/interleukin-1 receptor domain-containing protein [Streptomyces sp. ID05-26A]|nr:toll/interleukin-1 receptor domain-containing protein [Streptomyces sp. ID05-26A]